MQTLSPERLEADPLTAAVKEQLEYIYEETSYQIAGSLGRTAVTGSVPTYWFRGYGDLRDIDVHDPYDHTADEAQIVADNNPLPVDKGSTRWLQATTSGVYLVFPRDPGISVVLPASYVEPHESSLLGVPVRTFRPEILLGLNVACPYDRLRQRPSIAKYRDFVSSQPGFDPSVLHPFEELADMIRLSHPEYVRYLRARDLVAQLPGPLHKAVKNVYHRVAG